MGSGQGVRVVDGWELRSFDFDGRTWRARIRSPSTDLIAWPARLVVGADGTVWLSGPAGIARLAGRS